MKKILSLVILLASCYGAPHNPVIKGKRFKDSFDHPMPKGICRFFYDDPAWHEFEDSCYLYHIGDTIK